VLKELKKKWVLNEVLFICQKISRLSKFEEKASDGVKSKSLFSRTSKLKY